jgi:4-hydroxyphenylpyruvate dioxygenase
VPDFESFVDQVRQGQHRSLFAPLPLPSELDSTAFECACAVVIFHLCASLQIDIPVLQPLRDFENFKSADALNQAVNKAERWLVIAQHLGTDLILVCSNIIEGPSPIKEDDDGKSMKDYLDGQVHAFRTLGRRAQKYGIRIGYEPLSWGTIVNRWEQCWAVVKEVDMPNVGIILDSFNCLCVPVSSAVGYSDLFTVASNTRTLLCHLAYVRYRYLH